MKQLITTSRNMWHMVYGEKVRPEIEIVLGTSERVAKLQGSDIFMAEELETVRFSTSVEGLYKLAEQLQEFAVEAEELWSRMKLEEPE